ncbi:hypothetical protein AMECASPLE_027997 [Ameca splendens]|uniref:Uncharacterized protein n=1 Tax=Ameca splendens TaxID=208324 RepID=A0ABV1A0V7_9TELE
MLDSWACHVLHTPQLVNVGLRVWYLCRTNRTLWFCQFQAENIWRRSKSCLEVTGFIQVMLYHNSVKVELCLSHSVRTWSDQKPPFIWDCLCFILPGVFQV